MTEYAILLPGDESVWENMSEEEAGHDLRPPRRVLEGARSPRPQGHRWRELTHSRTRKVLRPCRGDHSVTDGPFAETVEQLSGFYLVESDDLDDLVEVTKILADAEGGIEIRACIDHSGEAS